MTAKEKAEQLIQKFWDVKWDAIKTPKTYRIIGMSRTAAIKCAIISVEEIIEICNPFAIEYWHDVIKELKSL